jgi:oligopeptide/dipeptide ABC transporter ATP-binding protein
MITHDLGVIAGMAHKTLVMYAGTPVEVAATDRIFAGPRCKASAGLLGSIPSLAGEHVDRLRPIHGTPPSLITMPPGCPFSPRCPLADELCVQTEPPLAAVDGEQWAACHHSDRLAAVEDPTVYFRDMSEREGEDR